MNYSIKLYLEDKWHGLMSYNQLIQRCSIGENKEILFDRKHIEQIVEHEEMSTRIQQYFPYTKDYYPLYVKLVKDININYYKNDFENMLKET